MDNSILNDDLTIPLFKQVVKNTKQASIVSQDSDQGLVLNAILDLNGSISLSPEQQIIARLAHLSVGCINEDQPQNSDILALLLDPEDISALIESNIKLNNDANNKDFLFAGKQESTILKLEDVLHEDDSLDELLPPGADHWYLYGDGRMIDRAITSPGIKEIHNELLLQQLLTQNYTE
ncbi:MAG: hypothetical protein ACI9ES_000771 [Oceanospirillaceae bacterium]|jgi:hypothetical protein